MRTWKTTFIAVALAAVSLATQTRALAGQDNASAAEESGALQDGGDTEADSKEAPQCVWLESLDDAIAAAKKEGKWVLLMREAW
ncbi:MAG: hypothetical protein HUU29_06450 [Planctomycetaceae bacterium]|nr:hypothetical protein [Planctomycetaceae bacterium]